jgi:hypothetical protein
MSVLSPQAIARPRGILQLLRKVFILIIVIPALLPQMCVASRYFGFLLCPVCSKRDTSAQLTFDEVTGNNSRAELTLYREILEFIVFLQCVWL